MEHVNTQGSPMFSSKTQLQMVRTAFCVGFRIEGGGSLPSMVILPMDNTTQLSGRACSGRACRVLLLTWPGNCTGRHNRSIRRSVYSVDHYCYKEEPTHFNI